MATIENLVRDLAAQGAEVPDENWVLDAACASADPRDFFPERGSPAAGERAKAVCRGCPTYEACLVDALVGSDVGGIRAETSETQRRRLRQVWRAGRGAEAA